MTPSLQKPDGNADGNAVVEPASHHKIKEVTILVTGFGPFQEKFPVNPSFEIARRLPEHLPTSSAEHTSVRIIHYGTPIRVAFDEVRELVPKLHSDYEGTIDVVLHIGMASGREYYCIERYGHRDGYGKHKDLDGKAPAEDEGSTIFSDCPATMTTSLDYDKVLLKWQTNVLGIPEDSPGCGAELQESHDPGHYLCDYIYFNSLAYTGRKSGDMEGTCNTARPVLFMHVPAESNGDMIDKGTTIATELIRAIADSYVDF